MLAIKHPLDGIRAKIARADQHVQYLNAEIERLRDSKLYRAVCKRDRNTGEYIVHAFGPPLDPSFSIVAGEAIYQFRSSLDHLVYQLVLRHGKERPTRRHQFPICSTREKYEAAIDSGTIKGISDSAASAIEELQPYHEGERFNRAPLLILHDLNITDKHRLLVLTAMVANLRELAYKSKSGPITIHPGEPRTVRPTEHGAEMIRVMVSPANAKVKMTGKAFIQVAFEKFGPLSEEPIIDGLQRLRNATTAVIDRLSSEFPQ